MSQYVAFTNPRNWVEVSSTTSVGVGTTTQTLATATPLAGTYLVIYSCVITGSGAGGAAITVQLAVGGTVQNDTIRKATPQSGAALSAFQYTPLALNKIITVNGSQAVSIQSFTSNSTVTITGADFDLVQIA